MFDARRHLRYLRYVLRHKLYVARAARRLGVPWLGLVHDLSKFLPDEWGPYARWFYGDGYDREAQKRDFDRAWLLHIHRNAHHPQHWLLRNDTDEDAYLPMPERYVREMVADWIGAGMAIKGHGWDRAPAEVVAWWRENSHRSGYAMHPNTLALVERVLASLLGDWP